MKRYRFILIMSLLLLTCVPPITTESLRPEGDTTTLKLKNNQTYSVELLSISDSHLYVLYSKKIHIINTTDINKLQIYGYDVSPGQKIGGALPALFFETIILLVANSEGQATWTAIAALSMVGTTALWLSSGPQQDFSSPYTQSDIEQLKLYCRFPQGLSDNKWAELLEFHNQEDVQKLP